MYTHAAGVDFMEVEMDVFFPPQVTSVDVEVPLGLDDIFPGEDKVFEVYLGASPGVFVSPTAYTNVTIINSESIVRLSVNAPVKKYLCQPCNSDFLPQHK